MTPENKEYLEKLNLAKNPNTPESILQELAMDGDASIRQEVATNPSTSLDLLRVLAKDKYWMVRCKLAQRSNIPLDILRNLARDSYWVVRGNVILNPNISSTMLVITLEYERTLKKPRRNTIRTLYAHKKLPYIAKLIIETLYEELI